MNERKKQDKRRTSYEKRILLLALMSGLPGVSVALWMLWSNAYTAKVQWTLSVFILSVWCGFAFVLRERVVYALNAGKKIEAFLP